MNISLGDIELGKNYSRAFGVGDISELVASMKEHGQITPVLIDENNFLVAGFRRWAAANELGWKTLKAERVVGDPGIINLIENMNRTGLSLWEEIQGIRDVFGPDPKQADICRALSKSRSWVRPRIEVWNLPQEFQDKVRAGQSGLKEIRLMLREERGPSVVTENMGIPSQQDVKRMVSWLVQQGHTHEASVLSFACGSINEQALKELDFDWWK